MAQLAHNDKESATTKLSPFFANFGKHANVFLRQLDGPNSEQALVHASEMRHLHEQMQRQIKYSNKKVEV